MDTHKGGTKKTESATRYGYKDFSLKGSLSECPDQFVPSLSECRI